VIITDHQMPRKNGLALVVALRAARFDGRIFVLAGALPLEARSDYLRLKVNGIAAKPISLAALRALLSERPPEAKVETVAFQPLLEATG
jgi:DNA-binding NarL/FixJ family response regulator